MKNLAMIGPSLSSKKLAVSFEFCTALFAAQIVLLRETPRGSLRL
jgi:hypothetical protein